MDFDNGLFNTDNDIDLNDDDDVTSLEIRKVFLIKDYPNNWDEFIDELNENCIRYKVKRNTTYRFNELGVTFLLIGPEDVLTEFSEKHNVVEVKKELVGTFKFGDVVITPDGIEEIASNYGKIYNSDVDSYLIYLRQGDRYCLHSETNLRKLYK